MNRLVRSRLAASVVIVMLMSVMPASAYGALTLSWERNWGSVDSVAPYENGTFFLPNDVAVDKWGTVFVAGGEGGDSRIQQFTSAGAFVKVAPTVSPTILKPVGIGTDRWGNVYVSDKDDARRNVRVFGKDLWDGGYLPYDDLTTHIFNPGHLDVGLDGTVYLVDNGSVIQRWKATGVYVDEWDRPGTHLYQGVGVSEDGFVYVANRKYHLPPPPDVLEPDRIFKFTVDGGYIAQWGGTGASHDQLSQVLDVDVDAGGNVFVADSDNNRIEVFDAAGTYLATAGTAGSGDQQFFGVTALGVGPDRTVYAIDRGNTRISKWNVSVPTRSVQIAGANRITTAIEASKKAFPDGSGGADIAVIATGFNWPDALGGAALAGAVNGPLLLTNQATLPAEVAAELARLEVKRVYILGGKTAVSEAVLNAAKAHTTMSIATRLEGADRYQTAIAIADETKAMLGADYGGNAFVVTGADFPDALAASPIAAANGWPIYLTPAAVLPADVQASMMRTFGGNPSNHGYIIGGKNVVSSGVEVTLNQAPFMGFMRVGGVNRYDTSAKVADTMFEAGMLWSRPAIATGENYPDALAGGVLQGSDCCPVLLTRTGTLSPETAAMLTKWKDHIYEVRFLGGDNAVTPAVRTDAKARLWQ